MMSSNDVCDAAGVTYRQLDFWIRSGVIEPAEGHAQGSGSRRRFHPTEVRYLRFVFAVMAYVNTNRAGGVATAVASRAVQSVRDLPQFEGTVFVTRSGHVTRTFPTDEEACIAVNLDVCRHPLLDELSATVPV